MKTCPKCGYENDKTQASDCPKCGLIYAKFQKAQNDEAEHVSAERALNGSLRRAMSFDFDEQTSFFDRETEKDRNTYPAITFLTWFYIIFSGFLVLIWAAAIKSFWSFLATTPQIESSERLIFTLFFAFVAFVPIAAYLAISGALKLGKDIADNTRATRNYLST